MDLASLLVSVAGIVLSVLALYKATSAQEMVRTVIGRKDEMEDRGRLHDLIVTLDAAKEAAIQREGGATRLRAAGRNLDQDLNQLQSAQDALRTKLPVSWNGERRAEYNAAADEIETALENIKTEGSSRDGWKDARATIQTIIPQLEQEERQLTNRSLTPDKT